jgi:hypothetical protein
MAPYRSRLAEWTDLIARDRGGAVPGSVNINYFAESRLRRAIPAVVNSWGLNYGAIMEMGRAAVDLLPMH